MELANGVPEKKNLPVSEVSVLEILFEEKFVPLAVLIVIRPVLEVELDEDLLQEAKINNTPTKKSFLINDFFDEIIGGL